MLNEAEKRILHGLYMRDPQIGRKQRYVAEQINWLAAHPYESASEWALAVEAPKHFTTGADSMLESWTQVQKAGKAVSHLDGAGMLEVSREGFSGEVFELSLTFKGAEGGRLLATRWGRLDFWYRERKGGVAGLALTIVVSVATTLLTLWIKHALS